jgi:hypothetical protein
VWDPDITPNGVTEIIRFDQLFGAAEEEGGLAKDGKRVVSKGVVYERPWELSLVAGQFFFQDNNEDLSDHDQSTDAYVFETQLIGSYKFSNGVKITAAPGWLVENAASLSGLMNNNPFNDNKEVSGATRNLSLLLLPGDVSFNLAGIKTKFYWDFSYNLDGRKRFEDTYLLGDTVVDSTPVHNAHKTEDDLASLVGLQFGENKKAGDWSFRADFRQTGIASVDPNLNDSDFAQGELNTYGPKFGLAYNFTDFAVGSICYSQAWNLRKNLIGGEATGGNAIADSTMVRLLQVDFSVKF